MIPLVLFPPVALGLVALTVRVYRSYALGAGLVVLAYLASAIAVEPIGFMAGGFNIFLEDLVGGTLLAATAARLVLQPALRRQVLGWMPFAAATAASFILGAALHGLKAAGVEYRSFFYLCAAALYCASFPLGSRQMKRLAAIWLAGAVALMGVAWFRWAAGALQLGIAAQWAGVGGGRSLRVLNSSQALFLAQAFLMLLYLRRHARIAGSLLLLAAALAGTVVVLQHRSVWVATALAWAVMAWHEGVLWRFARAAAVTGALLAAGYWLTPAGLGRESRVAESLEASVEEPFDRTNSTIAWRAGLWNEYLLEYAAAAPWQMVAGTGLGNPGFYRIRNVEVTNSAHNYFIFVLNRAGLLGLAALLVCYGVLLRRLRNTGGRWDYAGMLLTLAASQLVYFTVYGPSYDQGLLIGAAFGLGKGVQRAG